MSWLFHDGRTWWEERRHCSQAVLPDVQDWVLMHLLRPEHRAYKVDSPNVLPRDKDVAIAILMPSLLMDHPLQ